MAYKLIALDLDDTILDSKKKIPHRVKRSIKMACKKNSYVVLCTGRTRQGCQRFYDEMGLDSLLIASGGAEIYNNSGNLLFTKYLSASCAKQLLAFAYERGIHAQVFINGELVVREKNRFSDLYVKSYGHPAKIIPDILDKNVVTPKILFISDEEKIPEIREALVSKFPELAVKRSNPTYLEILHPEVSKGKALEFVADYYKIDRKDVIAVGDSEIDISMLEFAGLSVVVSNADAYMKEKADIICASNEESGVADIIDKYILEV
jgi:Cof subfamily protein (haloacid dehalogenase superfamily)